MPTYEYRCPEGHQFELLQKMSDPPRAQCPRCGRPAVRQISGGAALIFKGSGFYITDYGKDGKGPRLEKETEAKPDAAPAKSGEPASATEKVNTSEPADKTDKAAASPAADKRGKSPRKKPKS
jgi:putative FmdB family regulatory protein